MNAPYVIKFSLSTNPITRISVVSGTIPTEIGRLTELNYLEFSKNEISGTLPTQLGLLQKLDALYVDKNLFSGTLPTQLANLPILNTLWLSDPHYLSGTIPRGLNPGMSSCNLGPSTDGFSCPMPVLPAACDGNGGSNLLPTKATCSPNPPPSPPAQPPSPAEPPPPSLPPPMAPLVPSTPPSPAVPPMAPDNAELHELIASLTARVQSLQDRLASTSMNVGCVNVTRAEGKCQLQHADGGASLQLAMDARG
jgi:hypothetical protein